MVHLKPLSLGLLAATTASALTLDTQSPESIKNASSTLASAIVASYRAQLKVPGIFGVVGAPYYWYEGGAVFNALISYSHLANDTQYNDLITEALKHQMGSPDGDTAPFMPSNQTKGLGNDDQATWALAALTAAEVGWEDPQPGLSWLEVATRVFDVMTLRWDAETCNGGLKWQIFSFNAGYTYKSSFANGAFFLLSARLAAVTGNATYSEWAQKSFDWSKSVGLIAEDWAVFDGTDDRKNCSELNHIQWSASLGFYVEGAAVLYNQTDGDDQWKDAVTGFVNHTSVFVADNKALFEVACEDNARCNIDQRHFKGLTARSLHRAILAAPFIAEELNETLSISAGQAASVCNGEGEDMACGFKWTGEEEEEVPKLSEDGLGEVFNALEAIQGLLYSQQGLGEGLGENGTVSGGASGNATGTPTQSGGAPESTGAAGRMGVAFGSVVVAAVLAVAGLA
jgi:mannan endo-1,6-alpha-mannosidase